jgi:hypothetical protein
VARRGAAQGDPSVPKPAGGNNPGDTEMAINAHFQMMRFLYVIRVTL